MSSRILLVEDEPGLLLTLTDLLSSEGYAVDTASTGPDGFAKAAAREHDLVILDVMLPGKNGFDICKELRQQGVDTAILMLTAKTRVVDRVVGLKLGADDYLAKPFDPDELLARVEALLRRVSRENLTPVVSFSFGGMEIDFQRGHATRNGQPVPFAAKEIQLLKFLVDHRGAVVSRDELLQHVWEYQPDVNSRTVDVHVAWLRQKIEENPQNPRHLLTVRGVGYRFVP
jgi:two-component system, OmpR family, alkaline phosphatase synthesis response regulator PhoP